jgi:hypothetical protein
VWHGRNVSKVTTPENYCPMTLFCSGPSISLSDLGGITSKFCQNEANDHLGVGHSLVLGLHRSTSTFPTKEI